jgi:hypothetical protein
MPLALIAASSLFIVSFGPWLLRIVVNPSAAIACTPHSHIIAVDAEGRKVDLLNFDAAGFEVNHATIGRHPQSPVDLTQCFILMSTGSNTISTLTRMESTISMYRRIFGLSS